MPSNFVATSTSRIVAVPRVARLPRAQPGSGESRKAESGTANLLEPLLATIEELSERICEYNDRIVRRRKPVIRKWSC